MSRKFLYPGHNYLGPGNPLENGPTVDEADRIAKIHDTHYNEANTNQDVYKADQEAILNFFQDFKKQPNLPSLAGIAGLGTKHLIERSSGKIIYPNLKQVMAPPRKSIAGYIINHRLQLKKAGQGKPPQAKKPRIEKQLSPEVSDDSTPDETDNESGTNQDSLPTNNTTINNPTDEQMDHNDINAGTSSTMPNADINMASVGEGRAAGGGTATNTSGSGPRGMVELWTNNRQPGAKFTRVYYKQYHFRLVNKSVETRTANGYSNNVLGYIRYPFHDVPVNMLGFYLSKAEIHKLMQFTEVRVKHVEVEVYNKTGCLNFETASSISSIGNNNIGIYLVELDPSIAQKRAGYQPLQNIFIEERCWGNPYAKTTADFSTDNAHLGAQYVRRRLDNAFEYCTWLIPDQWPNTSANHGSLAVPNNEGLPLFNPLDFVMKRKNASFDEGLMSKYSYQPKSGIIGGQYTNIWGATGNGYDNLILYPKQKLPLVETHSEVSRIATFQKATNSSGSSTQINGRGFNVEAMTNMRYQNFTQSEYSSMQIDDPLVGGTIRQPTLIIGIEPLVTELNDKWEAVNCYVDITINTKCEIEITDGVDYINANTRNTFQPNYMFPQRVPCIYDSTNVPYPLRIGTIEKVFDRDAVDTSRRGYANPNTYSPSVTWPTTRSSEVLEEEQLKTGSVITQKKKIEPSYERLRSLRSSVQRHETYLKTTPGYTASTKHLKGGE